jgi:hypothetical protein
MQLKQYFDQWVLDGFSGNGANLREGMWSEDSPHFDDYNIMAVLWDYPIYEIKHVRMYLHKDGKQFPKIMSKLRQWADFTASIGVQLVVVFDDSIRSGFHCDVNNSYHNASYLNHLNIDWYRNEAWRGEYETRLKEVAFALKDYNHVVLDLMNEPAIVHADLNRENYEAFMKTWEYLTKEAYDASQGKVPITVGWINTRHFKPEYFTVEQHAHDVFGRLPYLHLANVHNYWEAGLPDNKFAFEEESAIDLQVANLYGKARYIGEYGVHLEGSNRAEKMDGYILRQMVGNTVTASSYWYVDTVSDFDKGFHDAYAIAKFRPEFNAMLNLFPEWDRDYFRLLRS